MTPAPSITVSQSELAALRKSYELGALTEADVDPDPLRQFDRWFKEALAADVVEPNAMTLATVGSDGRPSARIVLLKGYECEPRPGALPPGFVWFTNYASRKGEDLAVHPHACLLLFWPALERQIRIEGVVERTDAAESDAYFQSRPHASQIGAVASPQSRVLASRADLEAGAAEVAQRFPGHVPRPHHWGGYRLLPDYLEFWQGRSSRLHDRIAYRRTHEHSWRVMRLAP